MSKKWMEILSTVFMIGSIVLFIAAEFLIVLLLVIKGRWHLTFVPMAYLLPVLVATPLLAGLQAYTHIRKHLLNCRMGHEDLLPVRYELVLLVAYAYAPLVCALAALAPLIR
jgi:hypothetical protein